MDSEPFQCWCGEKHSRCRGHVVECSSCEWSGGNTDPDLPCHRCGGECIRRPCRKPPRKGAAVCDAHGANQRTKDAAKRNTEVAKVTDEARKQLELNGWEPVTDPYTALQDLAGEILALKNVLRGKVEELTTLKTYNAVNSQELDVIMAAYERALDRSEKILHGTSRLNLDERIAALNAAVDVATAQIYSNALEAALSSVALEPEQRSTILSAFGARLRGQEQASLPGTH